VLPDPIDPFGRLVAQVAAIEVAAEEQDELDVLAERGP
jgi:hypothetical protein